MKKIILGSLSIASLLLANNELSINSSNKNYTNSKTKVDGKNLNLNFTHKYKSGNFTLGYNKDDVDRVHAPSNNKTLHVKKYNLLYNYNYSQKTNVKASYIKIVDNLAPTDQGKIYGLGAGYKLGKGMMAKVDMYKSNYPAFDVNQYDISLIKGFKSGDMKGKVSICGKSIKIDGDKYGSYTFKDKDYFTTAVKIGLAQNGYFGGVGAFFGKRMFAVLDNGQKVQHHAQEIEKTYMASFGKKFKNFDIIAKYSVMNGNELPEGRNDVDTKVVSIGLKYKF